MKIQSMSANITKMALRDIYYYLKEKNFGKIILTIHDSIFLELHQETAEESIPKIIELMENSGPKIFDGMIVPVDADIGIKEKRTCIISGVEFYTYSHTYDGLKIKRNEQNVEPRVYALVDGNVSNIYEARKKLLEELAGRDDDWKIKNYDIINAIKTVN
jgi:hypothetical protein